MKNKLFLVLVSMFAILTQSWAQTSDLTSAFVQDANLKVNSVTNDVTYPWIVEDGYVRTPSYRKDAITYLTYTITLAKASIISFDYDVQVYSSSDYMNIDIDGINRFSRTTTTSGHNSSLIISEGEHTIQIYYRNYYAQSTNYGKIKNIQATTVESQAININLTTAGTLGTEVLSRASSLPAVKYMKLSGNMNSADWATLKQMTGLRSLDMEDANVEEIPANAFYLNSSSEGIPLQRYVFPKTLKTIGSQAFYHSRSYDPLLAGDLKLPAGLKTIGANAFSYNYLTSCTLPQSVTSLGTGVFSSNSYLKTVTLNENITSLSGSLFYNCTRLETINGIDRITDFGANCLYSCSKITNLGLAKPVTIGNSAFYSSGLTEFDGSEIKTIGNWAFYDTPIKTAILPKVNSMNDYAFYYCRSLTEVVLSDIITNLPYCCFYYCTALQSITLGASLTSYYSSNVFDGCTNITKVYCNAPTPLAVSSNLFPTSIPTKATLYVPSYATISYKLDTYWSKFPTVEDNPNSVSDIKLSTSLELASNARIPNTPNISLRDTGSKLTINGSTAQPFNKFTGYYETGTNSSSLINRSENTTSQSSEIRYYMNTNYWYFVCMPFDVRVSDIWSTVNAEFAVRYYDGASRASSNTSSGNWKNMPADGVLKAGQGYIFRVSVTKGYLVFPATEETHNNIFASSAVATPLESHSSATSADANWNLIGNPYPAFYDIYYMDYTAPITVWNTDNNTYSAYSIADDNYVLYPLQAFFVQKPDALSSLSFNPTGRQHSTTVERTSNAKARKTASTRSIINLTLSNGAFEDMTRIVINPSISDEYNADCDAAKMLSLETTPQLYTIAEDGMYAINEGMHESGEVKIGMWLPENGTFTISAPRTDCPVELYDNGELVSLPYTFSASAGFDDSRLSMVLKSNEATAIQNIKNSSDATQMFDLTGRRINDASKHGIYIINNQKVIK